MNGETPYPTNYVSRPEHESLVRRVELLERDGKVVAVASADIDYLKRSVGSMKQDLERLKKAEDQEAGGEAARINALAILGMLAGIAGSITAIVTVFVR